MPRIQSIAEVVAWAQLSPTDRVVAEVKKYLGRCAPGLDSVDAYSKQQSGSLYIKRGKTEFLLHEIQADLPEQTIPEGVYSLDQLEELNLPAPPAFIEGLFHHGETIVIAGRQKVGKSRLTQQMALALANGEAFLGMAVPHPVRVLMIDLENRLASLSQRFRFMGGNRQGAKQLFTWCAQSLDSTLPDASADGAKRLVELVDQVKPDILIIDPWRLWMGGDENDAREIVKGLKVLASARCNSPHLGIVIVHHVRKEKFDSPKRLLQDPSLWADAVSGHHALMSHVDACYGLERQMDDEENRLIVFGGIARNTQPRTLILDEDTDTLRFEVAATESAALSVMTRVETGIWNAAKGLKKFRFGQLAFAAETKNKKAVAKTLAVAQNHGLLRKEGESYIVIDP